MSVIIPAILPTSLADLEEKLEKFANIPTVDSIQIDVVDGRFAKPATWPYSEGTEEFAAMVAEGRMLPHFERFRYDIDLMVADPEQATGTWLAVGASRLTVHAESTTYLPKIITDLKRRFGLDQGLTTGLLSFGLAIGLETDISLLNSFLQYVDYVQFMGIAHIGHQGEPFDTRVVERVRSFHTAHPKIPIQVDGGVSLRTAPALLNAGVSRLIVGSALLKAPDLAAEVVKFEALTHTHGLFE